MSTINTVTREEWLQNAVIALKPLFSSKGSIHHNCQVSCGFTCIGINRGPSGNAGATKPQQTM
jgi:hypothetical protein